MTAPDSRFFAIQAWLQTLFSGINMQITPASSDASFRRYFRVMFADARTPLIVMDAPPDKEDCAPFIHAAAQFAKSGVRVPTVLQQELSQGFLLLDDLGNTTYLTALAQTSAADPLYRRALAALVQLQTGTDKTAFAPYDRALLQRELDLFPDWYITKHISMPLSPAMRKTLDTTFNSLIENNLAQPTVAVHRDYHSRNLMVTPPNSPGILDFQDAVNGPITYDLVSLLRDAYVEWEEPQQLDWAIRYWEAARKAGLPVNPEFGDFYRDFEWMGLQRHLKVLGIFARLYHRDGKDGYLKDLPLVLRYVRKTCARYQAFKGLLNLLDQLEGQAPKVGYTF
jgi:N-acetylmuramate 1-kinase